MKPITITAITLATLGLALCVAAVITGMLVLVAWRPDPEALIQLPPLGDLAPSALLMSAGSALLTLGVIAGLLAMHAYAVTRAQR